MRKLSANSALQVSKFLWPESVAAHGLVLLSPWSSQDAPEYSGTATDWEAFVNHTHIFDEFRSDTKAIRKTLESEVKLPNGEILAGFDWSYDESHPDFIAACELGRTAARLRTLKLMQDFPGERFRVYYTEYDNPIVRFHKVRASEPLWMTDSYLESAANPDLRNALIFDTDSPTRPVSGLKSVIH